LSGDERTPVELSGVKLGQYLLSSLMARGGTAEVYKAYHADLDRHVVIKVLSREYSQDPDWVRRFRREAKLLGRLDHPRILPIYDAGEHEGRPYLVTKYVESSVTLRELITPGPLPLERACRTLAQVAEALQAAHASGVVHRDVKPSNVLVTPEGECMVFDFGLAKPIRRRESDTAEGKIVGTPEYMSPEQCTGERLDHRSDIYSLGVLAYELITGRVPFDAPTPVGVMMKHLNHTLPPPGADPRLSPALHAVIARSMARTPEARFPSARDFGEALATAAGQASTVTRVLTQVTASKPVWRRVSLPSGRRVAGAAAALAALFVAGVSLFWFFLAGSAETPAPLPAPHNASSLSAGAGSTLLPRIDLPPEAMSLDLQPAAAGAQTRSFREVRPGDRPHQGLPPGSIVVECNLPVVVTLNGELLGAAPGAFASIPAGTHRVVLDAGQGRVFQKDVWVAAGSTARIRYQFEDLVRPTVSSSPPPSPPTATVPVAAAVEPPDRPVTLRPEAPILWEGYLTDSKCKAKGAADNHWRCLEWCVTEGGQRPMFYSRGKLYHLRGLERIAGDRNHAVTFEGWLDPRTNTITVVEPPS